MSSRVGSEMDRWDIQDAQHNLDEFVALAIQGVPQIISERGIDVAVVVSYAQLQEMPHAGLVEFLRNSPLSDSALEIVRDTSTPRAMPDL